MRRNAAVVFSAFFIFFIFQTNSLKLISNSAQPPTPGLSDDPGQTTCNHCHAGTTRMDATKFTLKLSPDSAGLIGSANVVTASTQYIPDSTQWVSLELNGTNGSTPKYGFQLTALDSLGNLAGTFTLTNTTNTSSQFSGATGRRYVGHKNASMTTTAWSFKWKAPHTGKVIFYYCGNIANGDGVEIQPGDSVYAGSSAITAGPVINGISDLTSNISAVSAYPLPLTHDLHLELNLSQSAPLIITLVNMQGEVVHELYKGESVQGKFSNSFDMSGIASGLYLLNVQSGSSVHMTKVMKL